MTLMHVAIRAACDLGAPVLWTIAASFLAGLPLPVIRGRLKTGGFGFLRPKRPGLQALRNGAMALTVFAAFTGSAMLPLGVATALGYGWPIAFVVIALSVGETRLTVSLALALVITAGGVAALAWPAADMQLDAIGIAVRLAGSVANAAMLYTTRTLSLGADKRPADTPETTATWMCLIGGGVTALVAACEPQLVVAVTAVEWPLIAGLLAAIGALMIVGQECYGLALAKSTQPSKVVQWTFIGQLPVSLALGVWLLDQPLPPPDRLAAMLVIVAGALLIQRT